MIWSRHLHIVHGNNYSIPITDGDLATSFPALRLVYAVIIILTQKASSTDTVAFKFPRLSFGWKAVQEMLRERFLTSGNLVYVMTY